MVDIGLPVDEGEMVGVDSVECNDNEVESQVIVVVTVVALFARFRTFMLVYCSIL